MRTEREIPGRPVDDPGLLLYRIVDALVDSFFPILADFDNRIDELENETFLHASDDQLQEIFAMKRLLVGMRKAVTPHGIDTYRDLLTSSIDVFLSTVSNRLNVVMKQLAVIATIFLPLTFITGFFGQNFGWLVRNIGGWPVFFGLGIGLEIATVVLLMAFFKRRGWF